MFAIRLKSEDPRVYLDFAATFKLKFLKPTLFSFGYDCYASVGMVASQLNSQIILLLKRPLTTLLNLPFNVILGIPLVAMSLD